MPDKSAALLRERLRPNDREMAELVEPALARWGQAAMRDVWLQRLQSDGASRRMHVLAIRGLASLRETTALPRLLELARDSNEPADVRVGAAWALGQLQESRGPGSGDEVVTRPDATGLASRLVAAHMLDRHREPETEPCSLGWQSTHRRSCDRSVSLSSFGSTRI